MPDHREPSHPPSDPSPGYARRASVAALGGEDRPMRLQLAGALLLGIVLVASGLYLWRRPHTPVDGEAAGAGESSSAEGPTAGLDEAGIITGALEAGPP